MTPSKRAAPADDELWAAAADLLAAFRVAADAVGPMTERIEYMRRAREAGARFVDLVPEGQRPMLLEATNTTLEALLTAGTRLRRLVAQALYADGMTMDEVATVLGVTRQRISALLRADVDAPGPLWTRRD
jgi:hypothetical protein